MAIQNFLSGGYYGKLGATVGQRWKNKRTIRTYVKPANPRTEVQQANRNKFANAVTFAQMGMQMNYYATVFDDPNFTHWNYRMKVARELRNQGLSGLDLIPLYPTSFVPPTLIQTIAIERVQAPNHITFAVENLNGNTDRVLSLMFAIYNESDVLLGYKLYLGYYYASNPGFLEVDVDDVTEINNHCYVRAVTNDDVDSTTDMIASPNLVVGSAQPETRDFNTAIREVQKLASGIKIIFEEMWKGTPTINAITITANFVSNGATATATATSAALENENGYCSILIPFETSDNQHLPAFPAGSNFVIASVDYEGSTWRYTKTNDTVSYSDTDLARNFTSTISSISRSGTTFTVTLATALPNFTSRNITLAIRAVKSGAWVNENVTIASILGNSITFEQTGATGPDIYAFPSGATITLAGTVTGSGVTYTAGTQTAQSVSNTDLNRSILSTPTWNPASTGDIAFTVPFSGAVATQSVNLNMVCSGRLGLRTAESQAFSVVGNGTNIVFTCTGSRKQNPMNTEGDKISLTAQNFVCNGVTYTLAAQDVNLRNAITDSYYLESLTWTFEKVGGNEVGQELEDLAMSAVLPFSRGELELDMSALFSVVIDSTLSQYCVPYHSAFEIFEYQGQTLLNLHSEFGGQEYAEDVDASKQVLGETLALLVEGVTYKWHSQWYNAHVPSTVGGFVG